MKDGLEKEEGSRPLDDALEKEEGSRPLDDALEKEEAFLTLGCFGSMRCKMAWRRRKAHDHWMMPWKRRKHS